MDLLRLNHPPTALDLGGEGGEGRGEERGEVGGVKALRIIVIGLSYLATMEGGIRWTVRSLNRNASQQFLLRLQSFSIDIIN